MDMQAKHYRVKGTGEVYPHVETVGDQHKLLVAENTHGWYDAAQLEECAAPEGIEPRDTIEAL